MAADHFGGIGFESLIQLDPLRFVVQAGQPQEQEKDVAQLFTDAGRVFAADGVYKLKGLLGQVIAQGVGRLSLIPFTAAGRDQAGDDGLNFGHGLAHGLLALIQIRFFAVHN